MIYFVYLLLVFWAIYGIVGLISPKLAKKFAVKLTTALPLWGWGIVAIFSAYVFFQLLL